MKSNGTGLRVAALLGSLAVLFLGFLLFVRPWYLSWGATEQETRMALPGDDIVSGVASQRTRAITIDAEVEQVWPWLAQLGQDRGGFYSFDLLENLVGCRMPTKDHLQPDRQEWKLGDKLWMYPSDGAGGTGFAVLRSYIPGRALCFATHVPGARSNSEDGSWSFVLQPIDDYNTRLLVRGRLKPGRPLMGLAFDRSFFEPVHFMMERRMMLGIKQVAESSDRERPWNHVYVVFFTIAFALCLAAAILVLRLRRWGPALAGFIVAGIVFQVLTFGQPSILLGLALLTAIASLLAGLTISDGRHDLAVAAGT